MEKFAQDHPWETVAIAALVGAWVAGNPSRIRFVFRIARAYASRKVGDVAMQWLDGLKVSADGKPDAGRHNGQGQRPAHS